MPYVDITNGVITGIYAVAQYPNQQYVPDDSPELLPPPETPQAAAKRLENAVQVHLDATAQTYGYDTAERCIGYLNSTNALWKSQASSMNQWRDNVWAYCQQVQTDVKNGVRTIPTETQLISELPVLSMPS